jgi:excisionase family DNA binding protein
MNEYITIKEVMKGLKVSRTTVYTLLKSGKLKSRRLGRLVRIRADDLRAFMGERKTGEKTEDGMSLEILDRAHRGRKDPETDLSHQSLEAETKLSKVYLEICKQLKQPGLAQALDIREYETGYSRVGRGAGSFFLGLASGIVFTMRDKDNRKASVLKLLSQADAIKRDMSRIEGKRHRLYLREIKGKR